MMTPFRSTVFASLFLVPTVMADVVINEIHYNGEPNTARNEFVELHNTGAEAVDVSGWFFSRGIDYVFPGGTEIAAGGFLVVAENPPAVGGAIGPYSGALSGEGDVVELKTGVGVLVDRVGYSDEFPWPVGAGGTGASMELIHPELDNDLGGSWRSSATPGAQSELVLVGEESAAWSWRQGKSEASDPVGAWRLTGFVEDGTWRPGAQLPMGFGGMNKESGGTFEWNTDVNEDPDDRMQGVYATIFARRTLVVEAGEVPQRLQVRHAADDGLMVWINGVEVVRRQVDAGEPTFETTANSTSNEGDWQTVVREDAASFMVAGENTIAVQVFNQQAGSSDLGVELEITRLAAGDDADPVPTPGARNSVYAENAPPQVRQVGTAVKQPAANEAAVVTCKVTDPDGVASVSLEYQVVQPGSYVSAYVPKTRSWWTRNANTPLAENPEYWDEENWTEVAMVDDGTEGDEVAGDGVYSVTLPGQVNRALVRYRIDVVDVLGARARVPYADDPSLNFAYFCYDGVPAYLADRRSVSGAPHTYSAEVMNSLPVYHLLTDPGHFAQCVGYNSGDRIPSNNYDGRTFYNWRATFVYNGEVYDHIGYRLRQRNARYSGNGKRSFKFKFNRGKHAQFHDNKGNAYPTKWRTMASHKLLGSRSNRAWGMDQAASHRLFDMVDIPASYTHWFHLRVVKGGEERPAGANGQYLGDFYGMELAFEEFDKNFLEARGLEAGNLYKLITGQAANPLDLQRYQAPNAVDDGSDFNSIIDPRDRNSNRNGLSARRTDGELRRMVNWEKWNWYHVVVDAVRHYDVSNGDTPNSNEHLKNRAYYFEPFDDGTGIGRLVLLPWDTDTTWGPNWNGGVEWAKSAIWNSRTGFTRPQFKLDFENVVREFRDLIWTEEQIGLLLEELEGQISAFVPADRDRWTGAVSTPGTGSESSPTLESVVATMKDFAFNADGRRNSYTGGTWSGGAFSRESMDTGLSGTQGRDAFLDWLSQDPAIPETPTISYSGDAGFPQGGVAFTSSAFADPEGAETFGSMEFRVAEVKDEAGVDELEWNAEWESGELGEFVSEIEVPASEVRVGRTYRARVRHCDDTGRWSHWSEAVEFVVSAPSIDAYVNGLMVSEVMYHPTGPTAAELATDPTWDGDDFEFIEILNVGDVALDLSDVRLTKGVDFDFVNGTRTTIEAGERIVLVGREAAFNARYGFAETPGYVIGEFSKSLANGGEDVRLAFGAGTVIREFTYGDSLPWPEEADGAGASLVLVSPEDRPNHGLPESWRASFVVGGTPGEEETGGGFEGDPLADEDGDGEVALVEYATGGSDADGVVLRAEVVGVAGGMVEFNVPRNQLATDVNFVFEVSADLVNWTAATFAGYSAPNVARYEAPLGDAKLYGRTRVELP